MNSTGEAVPTTISSPELGNDPPILRQSTRNVGPPKFYGTRYFIDVVDLPHVTSGLASSPIILGKHGSEKLETTQKEAPLEIVTVESDSYSPDQNTSSSTDECLRIAVDNFDDFMELDSELFTAELETFINFYRNSYSLFTVNVFALLCYFSFFLKFNFYLFCPRYSLDF